MNFYDYIYVSKTINIINKINIMNNNINSLLIQAGEDGNIEEIKYLIEHGEKHNCKINIHQDIGYIFIYACEYGYFEIVKYLLEFGEQHNSKIDINDMEYAFGHACEHGHIDIVKYLLEY